MTAEELSAAVKLSQNGSVVTCHVQPNASKTAFAGMYGTALKIALKSPPVDGKANKELCRWFAELADIPAGQIQLLSGQTSRDKRIFIPVPPESLIRNLLT